MKIRIAHEHHRAIRIVLGQHVGAGADRIPVECQVFLHHPRLAEEAVGLRRHRRKKRHRQPVEKLRVLAFKTDAVSVVVDDFDAGERILAKIDPRVGVAALRKFGVDLLQLAGVVLETDDVLLHQSEDGRMQARMGEALDLVFEVLRLQLARTLLAEIRQHVFAGKPGCAQVLIDQFAAGSARKRRVRLITDAAPDPDLIDCEGGIFGRRIGGQLPAALVVIARLRHFLRDARNQRVRALQVMVLQRRLVDLRREGGFVRTIGLDRIEVLRTLAER